MSDAMWLEGKEYISSKRASQLSGYAQDYIGQLARKGLIDAQRVGGLWFISMASLSEYKSHADAYVPQLPAKKRDTTLITWDSLHVRAPLFRVKWAIAGMLIGRLSCLIKKRKTAYSGLSRRNR